MDYGGADSIYFQAKPGASKQKHVKFILGHSSAENQDSTDTLSSSTSESSSSDDFFLVNPQILPKFTAQNKPPLSKGGAKPFFKNEEIDVSSEALYRLEESLNGSPGSTSQFSDITHESLIPQFSPTQSPPIQIMEKNGGFDPNRIPISVFSKSSTPTEWSVASNDSLFSIRIGESSFSRDHVLKIDLDLPKSREPLKSGELSKSPKRSGGIIRFEPTSPNFKGIEPYFDIEKTISEDVKPEGIQIVNEKINDGSKEDLVNNHVIHVEAVMRPSRDSYGANCHSDKSEIRVQPFVKPIKRRNLQRAHCASAVIAVRHSVIANGYLAPVNGFAALVAPSNGALIALSGQAAIASVQTCQAAAVNAQICQIAAVGVQIGQTAVVKAQTGHTYAASVRHGLALSALHGLALGADA
ncbi:hypothetical protein OROMI_025098 [Orobanche minor]